MTQLTAEFEQALLALDRLTARRLAAEAGTRLSPVELVDQLIVPALAHIGEGWEKGNTALAQVYMSGRISEEIVDEILPPGDPKRKNHAPMAIAVLNDYHLLGKRIVYATLRAAGFDLKDYGRVTIEETVRRARADRIRLLLISTLMLNSALQIKALIAELREARLDIRVIVGGAPFLYDAALWREVNADAMGSSAAEAVNLVQSVLGGVS